MPISDDKSTICGIVPPEGLHTLVSGLYKKLLENVHNGFGLGSQKKEDKDKLDRLHTAVVNGMKQHLENNSHNR